MATIAKPNTFSAGAVIVASEHNSNFDTIYNDYNTNITNVNISASAAIADTKLAQLTTASKVNLSALVITSQAAGDLIYASSASALTRLPAGTSGMFLQSAGTAAPVWANGLTAATQAEMEAGTSTTTAVTPGRTRFHPGVAKAWCVFDGTGTPALIASHNVDSSITDNGNGDYTLNITTDFSTGNFSVLATTNGVQDVALVTATAAGTITYKTAVPNDGTLVDNALNMMAAFGDQ